MARGGRRRVSWGLYIAAAVAASLDGAADARPVSELWAHLDRRHSAT
jgi:hypothetical protein